MIYDLFSRFLHPDVADVDLAPSSPERGLSLALRSHPPFAYTNLSSASSPFPPPLLFHLLHFSRPRFSRQSLSSSCYLSRPPARLIPAGKIYRDKNEIYESLERNLGVVFMVRVLLVHVRSVSSVHISSLVMRAIPRQHVFHIS